jgi:hypothetical protein
MLESMLPSVLVKRTVLDRTYAVLPVITCIKVCTLDDTSARETEEAWLKVIESLRKILAETVLMTHPCIHREEGNMLYVNSDRSIEEDAESSLRISHGRSHHNFVLLPIL